MDNSLPRIQSLQPKRKFPHAQTSQEKRYKANKEQLHHETTPHPTYISDL